MNMAFIKISWNFMEHSESNVVFAALQEQMFNS